MSNQREADRPEEFVDETLNRATLLNYLAEEPRRAREVAEKLGVSRSTVHRATEQLGDMGLVEKSGNEYAVTPLGAIAADEIDCLQTRLETAHELEPFLNTVGDADVDVPLGEFDDATVTAPQSRQAHVGVKRIIELVEESETIRLFSSILSPLYVDAAHREMLDGTEIEAVFDSEVVELMATKYREEALESFRTGRFHVLVGDDVPFELFLFDDRMGMAAHDDSGIAHAFVESTSAGAREWAEDLYRSYADDAREFELA